MNLLSEESKKKLWEMIWKSTVVHLVSYFIIGLISGGILSHSFYSMEDMNVFFRPITHPLVMHGTLLQILRGVIMGLALYPFRGIFLKEKHGWLALWGLFVSLAILSTAGASPGSVEGVIYTTFPLSYHLAYLPDNLIQTGIFSFVLCQWINRPSKRWTIPLLVLFFLIVGILVLSLVTTQLL